MGKMKELDKTIDILTEKKKSLTSDVDELEQYSRRSCLLMYVVQGNESKNTDEIVIRLCQRDLILKSRKHDYSL